MYVVYNFSTSQGMYYELQLHNIVRLFQINENIVI